MISVLIADDHQIVIDGIYALLENEQELEAVGSALNGKEAIAFLEKQAVDVVLMDITMPEMDGLEATRIISDKFPKTGVLVLTMFNDMESISGLIEAGASGYILKNTGKREMVAAIKAVAAGEKYYSSSVTDTIVNSFGQPKAPAQSEPVQPTLREKEVLQLIAQEYTTSQIADSLHIAPSTVVTHRKNLHSKLGVTNALALVKYAMHHGYLSEQ